MAKSQFTVLLVEDVRVSQKLCMASLKKVGLVLHLPPAPRFSPSPPGANLIVYGHPPPPFAQGQYKCVSADNGQDAVDKFKQHAETLEIVLMDINMPGMNGDESSLHLRSRTHRHHISPASRVMLSGMEATELIRQYEAEHTADWGDPVKILGLTGNVVC